MLPVLGNHEAVEAVAVIVLLAGGLIALAGSLVRRNRSATQLPEPRTEDRSDGAGSRRSVWVMLASASMGAGIIHLALGPSHLAEIGALGLGFFVVGAAQLVWAALAISRPGRLLIWLGVGGNLAVLVAWAFTRIVGLPVGPAAWMPEGIGWADSVTGLFESAIIAVLAVDLLGRPLGAPRLRAAMTTVMSIGSVPVVGAVVVLTTLALSFPEAGHQHVGASLYPRGAATSRASQASSRSFATAAMPIPEAARRCWSRSGATSSWARGAVGVDTIARAAVAEDPVARVAAAADPGAVEAVAAEPVP